MNAAVGDRRRVPPRSARRRGARAHLGQSHAVQRAVDRRTPRRLRHGDPRAHACDLGVSRIGRHYGLAGWLAGGGHRRLCAPVEVRARGAARAAQTFRGGPDAPADHDRNRRVNATIFPRGIALAIGMLVLNLGVVLKTRNLRRHWGLRRTDRRGSSAVTSGKSRRLHRSWQASASPEQTSTRYRPPSGAWRSRPS